MDSDTKGQELLVTVLSSKTHVTIFLRRTHEHTDTDAATAENVFTLYWRPTHKNAEIFHVKYSLCYLWAVKSGSWVFYM